MSTGRKQSNLFIRVLILADATDRLEPRDLLDMAVPERSTEGRAAGSSDVRSKAAAWICACSQVSVCEFSWAPSVCE